MKRLFAAALVVASTAAFAQEIGKEIPAEQQQTNTQSGNTNYDNPYATPPPPPPAQEKKETPVETAMVPGPRKMAFGINAGFGGGGIPSVASSGAITGGPATPTIGLKLLATDSLGINFDLGLGMNFNSGNAAFGFGLGLSIDAYLGRKDLPIRPFVTGGASFGKGISRLSDDFSLAFDVGAGGEYWFNDHFSLNGRALVGVPIDLKSGSVTISTFTPGVGATFYF